MPPAAGVTLAAGHPQGLALTPARTAPRWVAGSGVDHAACSGGSSTMACRYSLNMISAVTPKGWLRFSTFTGSMNAKVFLDFVKRLLHDEPDPVFLIVDGHPVHRSKAVRSSSSPPTAGCGCSSSRPTRPSSTRTNGCGRTSNTTASAKPASRSADDLRAKAERALRRLQRLPGLVMRVLLRPAPPIRQSDLATYDLLGKSGSLAAEPVYCDCRLTSQRHRPCSTQPGSSRPGGARPFGPLPPAPRR